MRTVLTGCWYQLLVLRRSPADLMALFVAPVNTAVFLAIVRHADRPDLVGHAVLAPGLMALWAIALITCGELIDAERFGGTLEALVAVPARMLPLLTGRVVVVTTASLFAFAESWLVAVLFGLRVPIPHPAIFVISMLGTALAMACWAGVMASVFVLARSARIFQNALGFPFFVLGGVLVPVAMLPDWVRPLTNVVFLSWSSDLLRDALKTAPVQDFAGRLTALLGLAAVGAGLGAYLLSAVLKRVRSLGTLTYA
ncbi:transport permease protein [Lentzea sp. NBRC 105346]|uniref:ABC transporter permease n=1 Tax=Lentzea sp. NBRC 105346 TaxID=3032205 RepID=UPI0024A30492|nr:ABC transporter permease [Lentzea sp. NBRC 105346]GLZ29038.1 transport permease protein [Lentzea sp. NBRC 105346]